MLPILQFWVIKHIPTGTFLPARMYSTHYEFDRPAGTHEPRLFKSERAAKNCATCWAQGAWSASTYTEQDGWESPSYEVQDTPSPTEIPGRRREDLEVLRVELRICS